MRLVPIVVVCALLAGCSGGDDDDSANRSGAAAPPLLVADEERDFAPGTLASGDVVTCGADGLVADLCARTTETELRDVDGRVDERRRSCLDQARRSSERPNRRDVLVTGTDEIS